MHDSTSDQRRSLGAFSLSCILGALTHSLPVCHGIRRLCSRTSSPDSETAPLGGQVAEQARMDLGKEMPRPLDQSKQDAETPGPITFGPQQASAATRGVPQHHFWRVRLTASPANAFRAYELGFRV
jgi:hypothetical protein